MNDPLELFFSQSVSGFFFMMLDEPVAWHDASALEKENLLEFVMAHQRMTRVNQAMLDQYGAREEDFLGLTPNDLFAHDRDHGREIWRGLLEQGRWHVETRERRMDGTPIIIDGDYICMYDGDGRVTGHFGVQHDITERRRAEEALIRERDLFTSGPVFTLDWGAGDHWPVLHVTANVTAVLGYTPAELTDDPQFRYASLIHPDDVDQITREVEAHLAAGTNVYEQSYRLRRKDGEYRWFHDFTRVVRNHEGEPEVIRGYLFDETSRKELEQQLLEERQRLAAIIAGTNVGTWEWNIQTGETVFNERWGEIVGYTLEEISPTTIETWMSFAHPEDLAASDEALQRHFRGEAEFYEVESRMRHREGHWVWVLDRGKVSSWTSDGLPLLMQGTHQDITERKDSEARLLTFARDLEVKNLQLDMAVAHAEQASRAKSEFLANMSHEIRTPLNGVIGMAGLLLETDLDPLQRRYAETARTSAEALLGLVNDILDVSKIEAGRMELETIPFDLHHLLDSFTTGMEFKAREKGLQYRCTIHEDVPREVAGDPGRLRQVLANLVGNAIKFTHEGSVEVHVSPVDGSRGSSSGKTVLLRFSIRDTGIGIAEDRKDRLFHKFSQVDPSTTRQYGGTGLGLVISREIVEMMGGTIDVSTVEGEGSEFRFTGRFNVCTAAERSEAGVWDFSRGAGALQGRILLAEDNTTNQLVALGMLQNLGLQADVAENGEMVLHALERSSYDLILMDVQMPRMDGLQTTRYIRESRHAAIPIVAMTAHAMREDRDACLAAGMNDYLTKPVTPGSLVRVLQTWLPRGSHVRQKESDGVPPPGKLPVAQETDVLDLDALRDRLMGDEQLMARILESFLTDVPRYVTEARTAALERDFVSLHRHAHTIKGAAANVGASAVREAARALEQAARNEDEDASAGALEILSRGFHELRVKIQEIQSLIHQQEPSHTPQGEKSADSDRR